MTVRFVRNSAGFRELLRSPEVQAMLEGKGEKVKAAAEGKGVTVNGPTGGTEPMPYDVTSDVVASRARVRVRAAHPAGMRAEVKYRTLGTSIDAARE